MADFLIVFTCCPLVSSLWCSGLPSSAHLCTRNLPGLLLLFANLNDNKHSESLVQFNLEISAGIHYAYHSSERGYCSSSGFYHDSSPRYIYHLLTHPHFPTEVYHPLPPNQASHCEAEREHDYSGWWRDKAASYL